MTKDKIEKRAFTVTEAADYACVSRGSLESWLARGLLKYEELPGNGAKQRFIRIRKKDLDEFLDRYVRCSGKKDFFKNVKISMHLRANSDFRVMTTQKGDTKGL